MFQSSYTMNCRSAVSIYLYQLLCSCLILMNTVFGQQAPSPPPNNVQPQQPPPPSSPSGTPYTPNGMAIAVGVISIIAGIIFTFFGKRIWRVALFLAGFALGVLLAFIILSNVEPISAEGVSAWGSNRDYIYLGTSLALGIVGGLLCGFIWSLGLFALGAFGGFCLAVHILSWSSNGLISSDIGRNVFIAVCALVGGILALFLENHVVIISTAIGGSYAIVFGVDCFLGQGFRDATDAFLSGKANKYTIKNDAVYALLGSWIGIAIFGILVQYRITGRNISISPGKSKK